MLALLSKQPGGPETLVLESVAEPRPKPGEVLPAVRACGVNYPDGLIIEDRYRFEPERPLKSGRIVGVLWGAFARRAPKGNAANLRGRLDLHARGAIRPVISQHGAIASLSARKAHDKIVVVMSGTDAP
jgi:NADPH:quinone reductase-like Zn-dependent oxidoreductase